MSGVPLGIGDYAGRIVLPDAAGELVELSHQSLAGEALVLGFVRGAADMPLAQDFAAKLNLFASVEAQVFAVAVGEASPDFLEQVAAAGLPLLTDPDARVVTVFGEQNAGSIVVFDAGRRVVALVNDVDAALEACTHLFQVSAPTIIDRTAPVLVLEDVLAPDFCQSLIAMWHAGQKVDDQVSTSGHHGATSAIKRRSDVYVNDRSTYEAFNQRMRARVYPEIRRAFQAEMASFEVPRISCYDSRNAGYFARHRDNRTPYTAHRRFALTLNLNTDYVGGEARFAEYGRQLYRAPAGGAVIFSCSLLHEVMPVTSGQRFGAFSFLTDEAGAQRERELIAAQKAKGRRGITLS